MSKISRPVSKETRTLINSIRRLVQALRVASRDSEKKVGLSAAQLFVLQRLRAEDDLSLNDLAERTLTHQSSVSVVVQRLVEKKLVKRERSEVDGRQLVLNLTEKGRKIISSAPSARQDWLIDSIEKMPPRSRKQLDTSFGELLAIAGLKSDRPPAMLFDGEENGTKAKRTRKK